MTLATCEKVFGMIDNGRAFESIHQTWMGSLRLTAVLWTASSHFVSHCC